jgi:uncharacterized protein YndB with AHSA1/START domain
VYREIVPDERLVNTEIFEGLPDCQAVNTATFSEKDGRTTLVVLVEHANRVDRDMHLGSGMEGGMQEAMDHLEKLAVSLA